MKKSIGIITLLNLSIPSLMPTTTMRVVASRKAVWAASEDHGEETKSVNMVLKVLLEDSPVKEKVKDLSI